VWTHRRARKSLTAPDAMRRIRDAIGEHDGVFDDPDDKQR
jgi:hypothetical protein